MDVGQLSAIDGRVQRQWRLESVAVTAPVSLAVAVGLIFVPIAAGLKVLLAVGVAAALIGGGLWLVGVRYRNWRYALADDVLVLRHGVWVHRTSLTPYFRVQNVDVTEGPLERWLGLKRLTIRTASASTDASIPGLDAAEADALRLRILERAGRDAAV